LRRINPATPIKPEPNKKSVPGSGVVLLVPGADGTVPKEMSTLVMVELVVTFGAVIVNTPL